MGGGWRSLLVLICAAQAMAGCGNGSSSPAAPAGRAASSPASTTKSQYISEGDAVCRAAVDSLKHRQKKIDAAARAEQVNDTAANRTVLAAALRAEVGRAQPQLDQLRALTPPPSDRVVIAKYLAGVAGQITLVDQLAAAIDNNDSSTFKVVGQQLTVGKAEVRGLAQGYGFKICGSAK